MISREPTTMKIRLVLTAATLALSLTGPVAAQTSAVTAAVADASRPKAERDTDARRKPAETLAFSGVKPGDKVGELFPGGGYYTRMLSDVVGPQGAVYALDTTRWPSSVAADKKMLDEKNRGNVHLTATPFGAFDIPEKIDLFWITQNYHDLHIAEYGNVDMAAFNKHVFDALKPGGTYFIVDHQANAGTTEAQIAVLHRIEKAQVIREVEAAGFKLVGENDALANPADDHKQTIFDKPIQGHTDQYMLKFKRP
jgi:predicted methyltransferase